MSLKYGLLVVAAFDGPVARDGRRAPLLFEWLEGGR
jgi:hypothetical protein